MKTSHLSIPNSIHPEVKAFIESAEPERKAVLNELRTIIVEALPHAEESFNGDFPVYLIAGKWKAGFANRKQSPMLYIMDAAIIDKYEDTIGNLRTGRSCVKYSGNKKIAFNEVRVLAKQMLEELAAKTQ